MLQATNTVDSSWADFTKENGEIVSSLLLDPRIGLHSVPEFGSVVLCTVISNV